VAFTLYKAYDFLVGSEEEVSDRRFGGAQGTKIYNPWLVASKHNHTQNAKNNSDPAQ